MKISKNLAENQEKIKKQIQDCDDIIFRPLQIGKEEKIAAFLIYIEIAVSNIMLKDSIIGKLLDRLLDLDEVYGVLEENRLGISDGKEFSELEEAMAAMLAGNAVLFVDGYDKAIKIGSKGYPGNGVQKTESEKGLRGSKEAFSDSVKINTALIRKRIRNTKMKVEEKTVGRYSGTVTALLYLEGVAYPPICEKMKKRLDTFEIDGIQDSGMIEYFTQERKQKPFPIYQTTERPDRAAQAILDGRAVLLCDHSPEALIFPATASSLFQTADDYYRNNRMVTFLRLIRYVSAFLAVTLPAFYVAAAAFQTQILPANLIRSMAEARSGVPFSAAGEVWLMELAFELLREAGVRVPGAAGNTIGIVGGLIVGQAAVSANLVSPITVTVGALTALGSFSIPNEELSECFRLWKYGLLILSSIAGVLGILLGWILMIAEMAKLESYGIPWLYPYVGGNLNEGADRNDSVILGKMRKRRRRPIFARKENRIRFCRK